MRKSSTLALTLFLVGALVTPTTAGILVDDLFVDAGIFEPGVGWSLGGTTSSYGSDPRLTGTSKVDFSFYENKSIATYDFRNNGNSGILDFTWYDYINGKIDGEGYAFAGMSFTVEVDTRYTFSGQYAKQGPAAAYQLAELYEEPYSPGKLRTFSDKVSLATPDETLVLGSPLGGDNRNRVGGDFSGLLLAGHSYSVFALYYIHSYADDEPTTARGTLNLTLQAVEVQAVPEPGACVLFGFGAVFVALGYGRKAARQKAPGSAPGQAT